MALPPNKNLASLSINFLGDPEVSVFVGYPKQAPNYEKRRIWRLYLTLDFQDYIEIREDRDLVGWVSLETQLNPIGGVLVWVRKNAMLRHVGAVSRQAQADFLRGEIASRYMMETGALSLLGGGAKTTVPTGQTCTDNWQCSGGTCLYPCQSYRHCGGPGGPVERGGPVEGGGPLGG